LTVLDNNHLIRWRRTPALIFIHLPFRLWIGDQFKAVLVRHDTLGDELALHPVIASGNRRIVFLRRELHHLAVCADLARPPRADKEFGSGRFRLVDIAV